jgi:hypothetical protein
MVFAFSAIIAAPASAKLSKHQKVQIRKQLRKQVKKHPGVVNKRSFLKKAALVNFKLPVTIRLRTGDIPATPANEAATRNPNRATLDLGASLGQREVNLGGSLAAEITFADSYDGGALGNVKLDILPSTTKYLTSTSIPLLWNTKVTDPATRWDADALAGSPAVPDVLATLLDGQRGCGNFSGTNLQFGAPYVNAPTGLPGYPLYALAGDPAPSAFLPVTAGVDDPAALTAAKDPSNPNSLGGNPNPFPTGSSPLPGGPTGPSVGQTVLRTAPLKLTVPVAGTPVNQSTNTNDGTNGQNGVGGSSNISIGKSGGEANLFGNIPGKGFGIDVTVSLGTRINSILRIVEQDSWGANLVTGDAWPAGVFGCRQVYTGAVQNYIPDVRLTGSLKISPGITADGSLRIAKATLQSQAGFPTQFAVAACLAPHASYEAPTVNYNNPLPPATPADPQGRVSTSVLPVDTGASRSGPDLAAVEAANCNSAPTSLVANSAFPNAVVDQLTPALGGNGYTVNNSGSAVSVSAGLNVNKVDVDVLIGDTP